MRIDRDGGACTMFTSGAPHTHPVYASNQLDGNVFIINLIIIDLSILSSDFVCCVVDPF